MMSTSNQSSPQEQQVQLVRKLITAYRSGIRVDSGADMPPVKEIIGDAFEGLGIPQQANRNQTMAQTLKLWLTNRTVALLRQRDPRIKFGLQEIRQLLFFYYHDVDQFLSNAQLSGDRKIEGRFKDVASLHSEWETLTGRKIAELSPLHPSIKPPELDLDSVVPITSRAATYSIDDGLKLVFGIAIGRGRAPTTDVAIAAPSVQQLEEHGPVAQSESVDRGSNDEAAKPPPTPQVPPVDPQVMQNTESLIQLIRSITPEQAFSKYSVAFALELTLQEAEALIDRWLGSGWVTRYGFLHDVEAYIFPDGIRREAAQVLKNRPALAERQVADFARMSTHLKPINLLTVLIRVQASLNVMHSQIALRHSTGRPESSMTCSDWAR